MIRKTDDQRPPHPEQDRLIARLARENAQRDTTFRAVLLALPLLSTVAYIAGPLFRPATALLSLLALTSLLATAALLRAQPPAVTGIAPLDAWTRRDDVHAAAAGDLARLLRLREQIRGVVAAGGRERRRAGASPLAVYLPYLNVALAAVVALMGAVTGAGGRGFGWVGMGNLPGLVYAVVLAAKVVMGSVDPERELSGLKYEYKGA